MKFNIEKLQQLAKPLPDHDREELEYLIANRDWLLLSVKLAFKIRRLMADGGVTQSELARRMGVTPAQVSKILSGQENLSLKTIAKVEAALGQPLINFDSEASSEIPENRSHNRISSPVFIKSARIENFITSSYSKYDIESPHAFS